MLALPRREQLAAGRLPRRRPLLRHLGLPDHDADPRGAARRPGRSRSATSSPAARAACCRRSPLVLVTTLVLSALFWRDSLAEVKSGVLASALYVQNWWLIFHDQSYFASTGRPPPLQHVWSLAIEEQFYLLWPPIVLLIALKLRRNARVGDRGRRGRRRDRVGGLDGRARRARERPVRRRRLAPLLRHRHARVRAAARLRRGGARDVAGPRAPDDDAQAAQPDRRRRRAGRARRSSSGCSSRWSEFEPDLYRGEFFAAAALATVVVVAATRRGSLLGRSLDNAPMRWIGKRSYGIYLWHWPVFVVTRPVLDIAFLGAGCAAHPAARDRGRDRRALVPLPRAADPARGLPAVAPARHAGRTAPSGLRRPALVARRRRARPRRRVRLRARPGREARRREHGPQAPRGSARRSTAPRAAADDARRRRHVAPERRDGARDRDRRLGARERGARAAPGLPVPDRRRRSRPPGERGLRRDRLAPARRPPRPDRRDRGRRERHRRARTSSTTC